MKTPFLPFYSILLISIFFFQADLVQGQTTIQEDKPIKGVFDCSLEFGTFLHNSEELKEQYLTSSAFQWKFEARLGGSDWKLLPFFSFASFEKTVLIDSVSVLTLPDSTIEMSAKRGQLTFGAVHPIHLSERDFIDVGLGLTTNIIKESFSNLNGSRNKTGFQMRLGYRYALSEYFSFRLSTTYDYLQRKNATVYRDWGGWSLMGGISVNFGGSNIY